MAGKDDSKRSKSFQNAFKPVPTIEKVKALVTISPFFVGLIAAALVLNLKYAVDIQFALGMAAVSLVLFGYQIYRIEKMTHLLNCGKQATGTLASVERTGDHSLGRQDRLRYGRSSHRTGSTRTTIDINPPGYRYTFTFVAHNGRTYEHVKRVPSRQVESYHENVDYEFIYDASNPSKSMLMSEMGDYQVDEFGNVTLSSSVSVTIASLISAALVGVAAYMLLT